MVSETMQFKVEFKMGISARVVCILSCAFVSLGYHKAEAADICSDLTAATDLSSTCPAGGTEVCTLPPGTTSTSLYKITGSIGSLDAPLPPVIIGSKTALCIADAELSEATEIYAQSFWIDGGTFQIGSVATPISAENKVTVYMTGSTVNGGVKSGHWGGAKVGQFVECALGRVATNQQARSKAHWPSGRLFSCQVEGLAIRARL